MSAINEVSNLQLPPGLLSAISSALWAWIIAHENDDVFTARVWILRKTFKVRDLEPFAELLLGPRPAE